MDSILPLDEFIKIKFPKSLLRSVVFADGRFEQEIIEVFADVKGLEESSLLFSRRIEPILIHSQFHSCYNLELLFKTNGGNDGQFIPQINQWVFLP